MSYMIFGIVCLVAGLAGNVWCGKKAFERRNSSGNQGFDSYGSYLSASITETAVKGGSVAIIILGLFSFMIGLVNGCF